MMYLKSDYTEFEWDSLLAKSGGHPLQSALWGEAKKEVYGITDHRFGIYVQDMLIALIRVESRGVKSLLKIGWIPQGPTIVEKYHWENLQHFFLKEIKKLGFAVYVNSPWRAVTSPVDKCARKTVWIDLRVDKQKLWSALGYGVRKSKQIDAYVTFATTVEEISDFYKLCITVSEKKEFNFQYSQEFLQYMLNHSNEKSVEAKLFLVKHMDKTTAGAFILRVGNNAHYMFGAVDRKYSKYRFGEFVQWSVIEWLSEKNCTLYDLEGIDEIKNPGVASFKRKMGGQVICLEDVQAYDLNFRGKLVSKLIRKKYN